MTRDNGVSERRACRVVGIAYSLRAFEIDPALFQLHAELAIGGGPHVFERAVLCRLQPVATHA